MNKLAKRLVIFAAAMVMMLASSLTVFAKENEAVPRIVDNVMYVDEGSNNVWVYGVAISIAGGNKTDIVPNNPSKKIDVMANGKLFKQLDGVVLLKDEKKDRVFLEVGSTVIEAPSITDKALATLKKAIADGKADSITATQILGTTADKGALAYQIAKNGKAVMTSGEELSKLLKTNANYISVLEAFEQAVAAAEEAAKEDAVVAGAPVAAEPGCGSGSSSLDDGKVIIYVVNNFCGSEGVCQVKLYVGEELQTGEPMQGNETKYSVDKGSSIKVILERAVHNPEQLNELEQHYAPDVYGAKDSATSGFDGDGNPYATFTAETEGDGDIIVDFTGAL